MADKSSHLLCGLPLFVTKNVWHYARIAIPLPPLIIPSSLHDVNRRAPSLADVKQQGHKKRLLTLRSDIQKSRKFQTLSELCNGKCSVNIGQPCLYMQPNSLRVWVVCMTVSIFVVGFALSVSIKSGNARASECGTTMSSPLFCIVFNGGSRNRRHTEHNGGSRKAISV